MTEEQAMDRAARESGLAEAYKDDGVLLSFYQKKLLLRSWAGVREPVEKEYTRLARRYMGKGPKQPSPAQLAVRERFTTAQKGRASLSESSGRGGLPNENDTPPPNPTSETTPRKQARNRAF